MGNVRIDALREQMKDNNIDVYYLNTSDYHMSEYVPLYFKTIEYFSGFSGSLATLLVDLENAYIFVDGRYHIQAEKQCLPNDVQVVKLGTAGALEPIEFIKKNYAGNKDNLFTFERKLGGYPEPEKTKENFSKFYSNNPTFPTIIACFFF